MSRSLLLLAATIVGLSNAASAQEFERRNHLSVTYGFTSIPETDETAFTQGIDFEHEVTERLGLGVVLEHAFGDIESTSLLAVADIHLGRGFVLQVGPGVEWINEETLALARVGMFYEIELGALTIAPGINYDVNEEEGAIVGGIAIGTRF